MVMVEAVVTVMAEVVVVMEVVEVAMAVMVGSAVEGIHREPGRVRRQSHRPRCLSCPARHVPSNHGHFSHTRPYHVQYEKRVVVSPLLVDGEMVLVLEKRRFRRVRKTLSFSLFNP
ncbi:unnamed protein product [Arctogadus glacialis]